MSGVKFPWPFGDLQFSSWSQSFSWAVDFPFKFPPERWYSFNPPYRSLSGLFLIWCKCSSHRCTFLVLLESPARCWISYLSRLCIRSLWLLSSLLSMNAFAIAWALRTYEIVLLADLKLHLKTWDGFAGVLSPYELVSAAKPRLFP